MSERRPVGRGPRIAGARRRSTALPESTPAPPPGVDDAPPPGPDPVAPDPVTPDPAVQEPAVQDRTDPEAAHGEPARSGTPEPVEEDAPEEDAPAEDGQADGPRAPRSTARVVLLALLVAALVAGAVLLAVLRDRQAGVAEARVDAVAAAREAAPKVLSYDYRRLDADFAAAREVMTESFREEYDRTSSAAVRPLAAQVQGVVAASVSAVGVVDAEPDVVRLLVFVNQASTKTTVEGTQLDQARVEMTMRLVDGTWLVDEVRAV